MLNAENDTILREKNGRTCSQETRTECYLKGGKKNQRTALEN